MIWHVLADVVLLTHFGFVLFVLFGAFLSLRWRWMPWIHLPAAGWGAAIEFGGWICPLTPLENRLRQTGGQAGYPGGFLEHYLVPLIYPGELTSQVQMALGLLVIIINLGTYSFVWWRRNSLKI